MSLNSGSGNLVIGAVSDDASAALAISSTTQGFLIPRMTTTQRDAISAPAAGLVIYNTTTARLEMRGASAWLTGGFADPAGLGQKNQLANGGLEVWQRHTTIAIAASGNSYGPDRWLLTSGANQACTMTRVAGLTVPSQWAAKVQRNNAQTGTTQLQFEYPFELAEIIPLRGKILSVSFVAKAGANWSPASGALGCAIITGTAAAARRGNATYTGEAVPLNGSVNLTTTATRYTITTTTAILATTTQMTLLFYFVQVGTAGADDSFHIDDVQVEIAPAATDFDEPPFEVCLWRCKGHYQKSYPYGVFAGDTSANWGSIISKEAYDTANCWYFTAFPVRMRITPTLVLYGPATGVAGQVRKSSDGAVVTATVAVNYISESGFTDFFKTSSFVAGAHYDCQYTASAPL